MTVPFSPDLFRHALDVVPDGILISDSRGAVHFANRQVRRLLGYAIEEILGQDVELLMPERYRHSHVTHRGRFVAVPWDRAMGHGRPLAALRRDGSELPVQISLESIKDANGTFVVATIREISAQRRLFRNDSTDREPATHADPPAQEARDSPAATHAAEAPGRTSASRLLRQRLHALSTLTELLASREQMDETVLTRALSIQTEALITMMSQLDMPVDQIDFGLRSAAEATDAPDEAVASLIERLKRDSAPRRSTTAGLPAERLDPTVLIVLRDWNTRAAAAGLLRIDGYQVLTAENAEQARNMACLHPQVGFVLTEQTLEDSQSGTELIGTLRAMLDAGVRAILLNDDPVIGQSSRLGSSEPMRVARLPVQAEQLLRMFDDLRRIDTSRSREDS